MSLFYSGRSQVELLNCKDQNFINAQPSSACKSPKIHMEFSLYDNLSFFNVPHTILKDHPRQK